MANSMFSRLVTFVMIISQISFSERAMAFRILPRASGELRCQLDLLASAICTTFEKCLFFKVSSSTNSQRETVAESDLTAMIRNPHSNKPEVYNQALSLLNSMETAPSCNRLAASTLLNSCQSIEGRAGDDESLLEDARCVYAAQLAMCEILGAGSEIPTQCEPFQTTGTKLKRSIWSGAGERSKGNQASFVDIDTRILSRCLQSLESRPQWWTSYSNSRQNAMVMCQAARVDIEKGIHYKIYCMHGEAHLS